VHGRSGHIVTITNQGTTHVLATSLEGTRAALATAVPLTRGARSRLVVIVPRVVPYPIPLDNPVDSTVFLEKRYRALMEEAGGEGDVTVCLCRRPLDVIRLLPPGATVVLGGSAGHWLPSRDERFEHHLHRLGYHVVFVPVAARAPLEEKPVGFRHTPVVMAGLVALSFVLLSRAASAQTPTNQELLQRIAALEAQLVELKTLVAAQAAKPDSTKADQGGATDEAKAEESVFLDYLHDLKYGASLDTYYGYNFNRPVGRVNLLRAYDVTSNNFALNQASVLLESVPDITAGRRFGARLDLQFGQATETLQGSLSNEPRPWVYRNIFQAYGTYVVPLGSGLTVDFGKWASSIGLESNYTKDQANYSRSYWFDYLPFYHMGARVGYRFNDAVAANYWITNGTQQTEAFNNYKDQMFGAVINPAKSVTWTTNFYLGQEHPDVQPVQTPGAPTIPTQPGLSITPIVPALDGRLHILDSYATWQATPKTSISLEGDYVVSRAWNEPGPGRDTTPSHVYGGAVYARQQVTPKAALAARAEYLRDDGGLFSGATQSLNEVTLTYEYKVAEGFLMRAEWRRDASSQPFFLSRDAGVLETDQQTATLGVIWWWGTRRGAW